MTCCAVLLPAGRGVPLACNVHAWQGCVQANRQVWFYSLAYIPFASLMRWTAAAAQHEVAHHCVAQQREHSPVPSMLSTC